MVVRSGRLHIAVTPHKKFLEHLLTFSGYRAWDYFFDYFQSAILMPRLRLNIVLIDLSSDFVVYGVLEDTVQIDTQMHPPEPVV
ncbi:hypothetical protein GCM10025858_39050 [Alicyclobacillus sacchari]|nr:hypothetical protein GCM10025858_37610 [Alicyclobacillus sacchari]GMA59402.1 hypothetical protein GCM10025858_39050 [Alicyclobacillus sacchari]